MNKDINLAGKIKKNRLPAQKLAIIRKASAVFAIATIILALLTFFISLQFSLGSAKSDQAKVQSQLSTHQKKIAQVRTLKDRITQLKKIESERNADLKKIDSIVGKRTQDIAVNSIIMENQSLEIAFSSSSLESLRELINAVSKLKGSFEGDIKVSELEFTPAYGYVLTIAVNKHGTTN